MTAFLFLSVPPSYDLNPGPLDRYGQAPRGLGSWGACGPFRSREVVGPPDAAVGSTAGPSPAPLPPDPTVPHSEGGPRGVTL